MKYIFLAIFLLITGCNYLRTFPLESKLYTEHLSEVQIFDESIWHDNLYYENSSKQKSILEIKRKIEIYIQENPNRNKQMIIALKNFTIRKGMNKIEILILAGNPTKKSFKDNNEVWLYKKWPDPFAWYYKWGKLTFSEGVLIDIVAQRIDIYK